MVKQTWESQMLLSQNKNLNLEKYKFFISSLYNCNFDILWSFQPLSAQLQNTIFKKFLELLKTVKFESDKFS